MGNVVNIVLLRRRTYLFSWRLRDFKLRFLRSGYFANVNKQKNREGRKSKGKGTIEKLLDQKCET